MELTEIDKQIGRNLAALREEAQLSQPALGAAMSTPVTAQAVSKWEKGTSRISAFQLVEIARLLGCAVVDLFAGVDGILRDGDAAARLTAKDKELLKNYAALNDPALQEIISTLVKAMALELTNHFTREQRA